MSPSSIANKYHDDSSLDAQEMSTDPAVSSEDTEHPSIGVLDRRNQVCSPGRPSYAAEIGPAGRVGSSYKTRSQTPLPVTSLDTKTHQPSFFGSHNSHFTLSAPSVDGSTSSDRNSSRFELIELVLDENSTVRTARMVSSQALPFLLMLLASCGEFLSLLSLYFLSRLSTPQLVLAIFLFVSLQPSIYANRYDPPSCGHFPSD